MSLPIYIVILEMEFMLIYDSLLTLEQDGLELCRFTYMGFFFPQ